MARRSNILSWPYRPLLNSDKPGLVLEHHGGSALAWVRIVADGQVTTSADVELIANSRLLVEQREVEVESA